MSPTCQFKVREQTAIFWLGSCVDGEASGGGTAVSRDWIYMGDASNGRANGMGYLTHYIDVDMNADSVNLFPSLKRRFSERWRNGRVDEPGEDQLVGPPNY